MWKLKIEGNWYPVEIVGFEKGRYICKVPSWDSVYGDSRAWKIKRKELKFYAN